MRFGGFAYDVRLRRHWLPGYLLFGEERVSVRREAVKTACASYGPFLTRTGAKRPVISALMDFRGKI